jgi:plasmid stability protein
MKTTLDLPDDLMRKMKIRAATQGRKLKDVMADAIRDSLAVESPARILKVITPDDGGLPYFACDPPSEATPSHEEIQKVIEQTQLEEDLQRAGITL